MTESTDHANNPDQVQETALPRVELPLGDAAAQSIGAESESALGAVPAPGLDSTKDIESRVIEALKTCFDPEIPVNIYELGLIYSVDVAPPGAVVIRMTLTSPACPVAGSLPPEVETKVRQLRGVTGATVDLVWDPPWNPSLMSEAAKLQLNMM